MAILFTCVLKGIGWAITRLVLEIISDVAYHFWKLFEGCLFQLYKSINNY
jgi:hypothetical protein